MKSILISDIKSKSESIIPFGLNFTRYINDQVTIIHVVDPRKQHAVSSAYADSQSIEVGQKLSHKEIIQREINKAKTTLDKLLSHEASRLNFPLRIKTSVTENSLEKQLSTEIENYASTLIITSAIPDGSVIDDLNELIYLANSKNIYILIVPPGSKLIKPEKALMLYDFNIKENKNILSLMNYLSQFKLSLNAVEVADKNNYTDLELKSSAWEQVAKNHKRNLLNISTNILKGKRYIDTVLNYINRNAFDLAILPGKDNRINYLNIFSKSASKHLIGKLNIPVLIY